MRTLIETLHREHCSLVLRDAKGNVATYNKKGVRDLEDIYSKNRELLYNAQIADKVIGKAAAAYIAVGMCREVYADVMSEKAIPVLANAGVSYSYNLLVPRIIIPKGDNRCPLEEIVADYDNPRDIINALEQHFAEMQKSRE